MRRLFDHLLLYLDHMVKTDEMARHVVVNCKGCWYKVNIFAGDRLLKASEIER